MTSRVQTLRSAVGGSRPPAPQLPGTLYTNWPDRQIGVVDASGNNNLDLVAVRFFSTTASYVQGDAVFNLGAVWTANGATPAGAWNAAQWTQLATAPALTNETNARIAGDAATLTSANNNANTKVPLAGGTMTGPLILNADPTASLGAATMQYVLTHGGAVTVSDTPPASPLPGALWFDSLGAQLYVNYSDGTSTQWVIAVNGQSAPTPPPGVTDGSNAPAGAIGEYIAANVASASPVTLTTALAANLTTISLTAGDWDVEGSVTLSAASGMFSLQGWINTVPGGAVPTDFGGRGAITLASGSSASSGVISTGTRRLSTTAATTAYLFAYATFSTGTCSAYGLIRARRVR